MIPYDKRSGKIWYNNELVDWQDVKVHVLSHGLHYGSCVFEGERVYDGNIFKLEEHTDRFFYSAERLGFKIPYSKEEINVASKKIILAQNVQNGYVRPVAWRGSEMMAISVVPPPISTTMDPLACSTGRPAPMAAAIGSSIKRTSLAPALATDSRIARRST